MRIADLIIRTLHQMGLQFIAGAPGTSDLSLVDASQKSQQIEYYFTNHENIAVGIADGFARATGRMAAVNVHATQGTLNALGFFRVALRDRVPLLCIASYPATDYVIHEPNHFLSGLLDTVRPCVKWTWLLHSPNEIEIALQRAFSIANTEPKGPVYLAIPQDFLAANYMLSSPISYAPLQESRFDIVPNDAVIRQVAELITGAKMPLILAGNEVGFNNSQASVVQLANTLGAPVISEAMDRGPMVQSLNFAVEHDLSLGLFSSTNTAALRALRESDCVISLGYITAYERILGKLDPSAVFIDITSNTMYLGKNLRMAVGVVGEVGATADAICTLLSLDVRRTKNVTWAADLRREYLAYQDACDTELNKVLKSETRLTGYHLAAALQQVDRDHMIVDDSQCFGYYLKHYVAGRTRGRVFGSLASHLGWALPAAVGMKIAHPDLPVIATIGDGSFSFSMQALLSACRYSVPIVAIVCNNSGYMSLQLEASQTQSLGNRSPALSVCKLTGKSVINAAAIANACGAIGYEVNEFSLLSNTLQESLVQDRPVVIDVRMSDALQSWEGSWLVVNK